MDKVLFVKSSTNVGKLAGSIIKAYLAKEETALIKIRCVGAGSVNQAVKAIILANKSLARQDITLSCTPEFLDSVERGISLTVIEFTIHSSAL